MNPETLDRILSCPSLPSLPAVAVKVIELSSDPDLRLEVLAETIQNDQGLTAKIIRTVNSSFYGLRRKCNTIHQALVILGMSSVKSLALGFSLVESIGESDEPGFDYISYWRRGLYGAVAAKLIAVEAGKDFADEVFLAGLLQDVGMIALYRTFGMEYVVLLDEAENDSEIASIELGRYELTHCDVGAMLTKRWKFPEEFVLAIKFHHTPTAAPLDLSERIRCVHIANIAHDVLTDENPAPATARFRRLCRDWLSLTEKQADGILSRVADAAVEMSSLLKLDTGDPADAEEILSRAQEKMVETAKETNQACRDESFDVLLMDSQQTDPLTGAMTRPAFDIAVRNAFTEAKSDGTDLCVLLVLIDNYARIAEERDTVALEEALIGTAALLKNHFEPAGGIISRWADSVFAIVIRGCGRAATVALATEFRTNLQRASRAWIPRGQTRPLPITVSVGAAILSADTTQMYDRVETLIAAAARSLQNPRDDGGNSVRSFRPQVAA